MRTSRRSVLGSMGAGAALAALPGAYLRTAAAQSADAALGARIQADLEQHASFGEKFSGSPGDTSTAQWIAGRLRGYGYEVAESSFAAPYFVPQRTGLFVGEHSIDVIPQAPVVTTSSQGVRAPLALVEGSTVDTDVRDRLAVIVLPFARHAALFTTRGIGMTVYAAAQAGAAGIVIVTSGPSGEAVALNAPEEPFVDVPAAVIAPDAAGPVIEAARDGRAATLVLDGAATHRPSRNVVARLERGERWLAMSTPRSGWFDCVTERGTGTAAFLEIAQWAVRRFPDTSIFLMNTGGHEYFFAGSHRVLHEAPAPERTRVWAHIGATLAARDARRNPDGGWALLDTPDPNRWVMTTAAAHAAVQQAFGQLEGYDVPREIQPQAGELSTFTDLGHERAFAALGVHRWFHTRGDTLDKASAELVVPVLRAHQRTIEALVAQAG